MGHDDEGMRWWAVVGLHLLGKDAMSARDTLLDGLTDSADEIRMFSAWTLVNLGDRNLDQPAMQTLNQMLFGECENPTMLFNVLDWMGEPALPLVQKYIEKGGDRQGRYGIGILGRIAQLQGW